MTNAAKHLGKRVNDFFCLPSTVEYLDALDEALPSITGKAGNWIQTKQGRYGGTWGHPKMAVFFARWLDGKLQMKSI